MNCFSCCRPKCDPCCDPCCICDSKRSFSHIFFPPPPPTVTAIQVQLQDSSEGSVANGANVIFDTIILNTSSGISYDDTTGVFTVNTAGRYFVSWWINTDGASQASSVVFSAESGATSISASSLTPTTSLQLYGQGLFDLNAFATLSLVNNSGDTVILGTSIVQADIVIQRL